MDTNYRRGYVEVRENSGKRLGNYEKRKSFFNPIEGTAKKQHKPFEKKSPKRYPNQGYST